MNEKSEKPTKESAQSAQRYGHRQREGPAQTAQRCRAGRWREWIVEAVQTRVPLDIRVPVDAGSVFTTADASRVAKASQDKRAAPRNNRDNAIKAHVLL